MIAGRIPLVDLDAMQGTVAETLRSRPQRLNIIGMMAHAEGCVLPQLQLGRAVNNEQTLNASSRELLILLAARMDGGEYVWRQHLPIAVRLGITDDKVHALRDMHVSSPAFTDAERALLAYGEQVVRGGDVEEPVFKTAAKHFSMRELVEAIIAIGYYMTMNRLTNATRTPFEA